MFSHVEVHIILEADINDSDQIAYMACPSLHYGKVKFIHVAMLANHSSLAN